MARFLQACEVVVLSSRAHLRQASIAEHPRCIFFVLVCGELEPLQKGQGQDEHQDESNPQLSPKHVELDAGTEREQE